jgi:hypothetical protein
MVNKLLRLVDNEAPSMALPRDDVGKAIGLNLVKDSVQLERKGNRNTSASAVGLLFDLRLVHVLGVVVVVVNDKVTVVLLGSLAGLLGLSAALGTGLLRLLHLRLDSSSHLPIVAVEVVACIGPYTLLSLWCRVSGRKKVAKQPLR